MFLIEIATACLSYLALFNLAERLVGSGLVKSSQAMIFLCIETTLLGISILCVLGNTIGLVSTQTLFDYQYMVIGYLLYHLLIIHLYPEMGMKTSSFMLIMLSLASYLYSFGIYSWIYSWTLFLGIPRIYGMWLNGKEETKTIVTRTEIGLNLIFVTFSIFFFDLLPLGFFLGLLANYSGLLA